jgi:hypothetical protein
VKHLFAALAVAALFAMPAKAQDEAPASQSTILANVGNGQACGKASYPEYCYGVPTNQGGTFWLDAYYNGYNNNGVVSGFILFNGVADLQGSATITTASTVKNSQGLVTSLTIGFNGTTADDGGTYTGTAIFTFTYYKGGYGRNYGYYQTMTGGTVVITYN